MSVRSSAELFLDGDPLRVAEGRIRSASLATLSLVRTALVVLFEPAVQVFLQLRDRPVDLLPQGDLVELSEPVGLGVDVARQVMKPSDISALR